MRARSTPVACAPAAGLAGANGSSTGAVAVGNHCAVQLNRASSARFENPFSVTGGALGKVTEIRLACIRSVKTSRTAASTRGWPAQPTRATNWVGPARCMAMLRNASATSKATLPPLLAAICQVGLTRVRLVVPSSYR